MKKITGGTEQKKKTCRRRQPLPKNIIIHIGWVRYIIIYVRFEREKKLIINTAASCVGAWSHNPKLFY